MKVGPLSITFGDDGEGSSYADTDQHPGIEVVSYDERPPTASYGLQDAPSGTVGTDGDTRFDTDMWALDDPPELQGLERFRTYKSMIHSDPAVKSNIWVYKLPIRSAEHSIVAASTDGIDEEIADGIRWNFGIDGEDGILDLPWQKSVDQGLRFIDQGAMFEEIIWGDVVEWTRADLSPRLVRPITRLAPRLPVTITHVETDPKTGLIAWIEQNLPHTQRIPGDKLAYYVLDREGAAWHGVALTRSMFAPWKFKRQMMIAHSIAYDRWSAGIPVVKYPAAGGTDKNLKEARRIGKNVRGHERAYVVMENATSGEAGWDFSIEQGDVKSPLEMLHYYDQQMSESTLAHALNLGSTQTGSRAVAEYQIEPLYLAIQAVADDFARDRRKQVLRKWVDVNYGPEYRVPKLEVGKIMAQSLQVISTTLANLTSAGFNFTDLDTQNYMRKLANLPELPEAVRESLNVARDAGLNVAPFVPQEGSPVGFADVEQQTVEWHLEQLGRRYGVSIPRDITPVESG